MRSGQPRCGHGLTQKSPFPWGDTVCPGAYCVAGFTVYRLPCTRGTVLGSNQTTQPWVGQGSISPKPGIQLQNPPPGVPQGVNEPMAGVIEAHVQLQPAPQWHPSVACGDVGLDQGLPGRGEGRV